MGAAAADRPRGELTAVIGAMLQRRGNEMTAIEAIATTRSAIRPSRKYRRPSWSNALPYLLFLAAIGIASAVTAITHPLLFADIFSRM